MPPIGQLIFFSLYQHIFYVTQCSKAKNNLGNILHHSNGHCSIKNMKFCILLIALSIGIRKFTINNTIIHDGGTPTRNFIALWCLQSA